MVSYGVNVESLSHLGLVWYQFVTDGQTDRIMTVVNGKFSNWAAVLSEVPHSPIFVVCE